jgi:hypothetical protein
MLGSVLLLFMPLVWVMPHLRSMGSSAGAVVGRPGVIPSLPISSGVAAWRARLLVPVLLLSVPLVRVMPHLRNVGSSMGAPVGSWLPMGCRVVWVMPLPVLTPILGM